jgi:hypothetical protein
MASYNRGRSVPQNTTVYLLIYDDLQRGIFRLLFPFSSQEFPPCQEEFPINETTASKCRGHSLLSALKRAGAKEKNRMLIIIIIYNALTATIKKKDMKKYFLHICFCTVQQTNWNLYVRVLVRTDVYT